MRFLALSWLLVAILLLGHAEQASAYVIASGVTHPCHETLTIGSISVLAEELEAAGYEVELPEAGPYAGIADLIFAAVGLTEADLGTAYDAETRRFLALSLLVGVRQPDTEGHSAFDFNALRRIHADPTDQGQHLHCLRGPTDDDAFGDLRALEGIRALVLGEAESIAASLARAPSDQLAPERVQVDGAGDVELLLYEPAVHLGRALHTLQDCYAHTLRTSDAIEVLSVLNFVDAASGHLIETRDGMAHSHGLDECQEPQTAALIAAAKDSSVELVRASLAFAAGDSEFLLEGLGTCPDGRETCGWFPYAAECRDALLAEDDWNATCCSPDSDYCDTPFLPIARTGPTRPLCSAGTPAPPTDRSGLWLSAGLFWLAVLRRRRGPAPVSAAATVLIGLLPDMAVAHEPAPSRHALPFHVAFEAQGSVVSGTRFGSSLDVSFGPRLRAGFELPTARRLRAYLAIEQTSLLALEYMARVDPGVLALALGGELLFSNHLRAGLALGPTFLIQDTPLHAAGTIGLLLDVRPIGVRLPLGSQVLLTIEPITASLLVLAPEAPQLATLHYRAVLGIEWESKR